MPPAAVFPATRRPYYRAGRHAVSAPLAGQPQELPMGRLLTLCKRSVQSFGADQCATLAAAIAYHTVFALFPIALFGVAVLGFVVGDGAARQNVVQGITKVMPLGDTGMQALDRTLQGVSASTGWLSLIGVVTAAWGASGL